MIRAFLSRPLWVKKHVEKHLLKLDAKLEEMDFEVRTVGVNTTSFASPFEEVVEVLQTCQCAIILGLPFLRVRAGTLKDQEIETGFALPSEWNQIEAAISIMLRRPTPGATGGLSTSGERPDDSPMLIDDDDVNFDPTRLDWQRSNMVTQPTFATCCIWLTMLMVGSPAACAAPPADEPLTKLAVLDPLVGSWVFGAEKQDGFSARQECRWILNKQFLEIDTRVLRPGHPPSSWRTLITYDQASNCYRQWKFSDNGVVSTAHGAWNENASSLTLSGRTPNGNDSESSIEIIDDDTMIVAVREFLDAKHTRMAVVRLTLSRVRPEAK